MLLGIDVGGTFTDAVILDEGRIVAAAKSETTHGNLLEGILSATDRVLSGIDKGELTRVALSTTIVTNALVEGRTDQVGLLVMAGPGMDYTGLLPAEPRFLTGYIDHRGREVAEPNKAEVLAACQNTGSQVFAVAGKFAVRNPAHEQTIAGWLQKAAQPLHISLSSQVSGSLNLWRRANSAYYNAAVWRHFGSFADAVEQALTQRGITAPVYILKADGGTMPLALSRLQPVEAIFTGPAASVLGIMALTSTTGQAISLDIGGTTTDIALWQEGKPLFAHNGARIAGFPTSVQAFRLKSVGIGGDSFIRRENGLLKVGPQRVGPAMAVGGNQPALSDALIVAGMASFGSRARAMEAVRQFAAPGQGVEEAAEEALALAADEICRAALAMIEEQAAEPVYKVNDIIHQEPLQPGQVIGIGGAAAGLAPLVARQMGITCQVPEHAAVANAIGAAVAKPTMEITLRADTTQGYYTVAELGVKQKLPGRNIRLEQARQLAAQHLAERAAAAGIPAEHVETVYEEEFNLVRGFNTTGRIITCRLQIKPGVLADLRQKGETL